MPRSRALLAPLLTVLALSAAADPPEGPPAPPRALSGATAGKSSPSVEEWRSLKFGLFIHFGLYSIPGGVWNGEEVRRGYSEQIQSHGKIPRKDYARLTEQFNPEKWDPDAVALLAKEAGMRYIVLTAKHHDGFNLFDTEYSGYDVVDATPYKRDIVKGLADACARHGLKFGVYFSIIDWNFPYAPPISDHNSDPVTPELQTLITGQLEELMTNYGPLCEIWFDMGAPTAEQSKLFADTVHQFQPAALVSGRVWNNAGDFLVMGDNQIPDETFSMPWETPASIYHTTWGYRSWQVREDLPGKVREKIRSLVRVAARGGNYLLNIGPRGDGSIVEFEADVLKGVGAWLKRNGESVFAAGPAENTGHPAWGEITRAGARFYLHVFSLPQDGVLELPRFTGRVTSVYQLDDPAKAPRPYHTTNDTLRITLPLELPDADATVYVVDTEGPAGFTPAHVVAPGTNGVVTLTRADLTPHFGVSGADYYSQKITTVALQGHAQLAAGAFRVEVSGESIPPDRPYRLRIGTVDITGPLPLSAASVVLPGGLMEIRLERADPAHSSEDLGLAEPRILITPNAGPP